MTSEQNKAIALIIPLIVKNNAGGVAIALRDAGYSKKFIPDGELEAKLFQLYNANPEMFFQVMKNISWNYGEIETNKPEIRDELIKLISETGAEVSKDDWWKQLIDIIAAENPMQQERKQSKGKDYGLIFLIVIASVGIGIALFVLLRSE